jgi:arylsulfatase A-like enzyme
MEPHYPYLPPERLRHRFTGPGAPPVAPLFFTPDELSGEARRTKRFTPEQVDWIGRLYDEEILAADEALAALVAGLRSQGRWERTALAFTADHGEELWDHGAFEHGHALYGELIRVPLLIRAPDLAAGRVEAQVQHADLFQTLLALGGAAPPAEAHGVDLRKLCDGQPDRPVLSEDCLYGPPRVALTQGGHRLIVNLSTHAVAVFAVDPFGQTDVPVRDPAEAQRLSAPLMEALQAARGDLAIRALPEGTAPLTDENMEKLRALGYIR